VVPGQPLEPGQIYESNSQLLVAAVEDAGGEARRLHFVPDDVDQFLAAVRAELATADLLITSGGVSAGAYEVVKDAFRQLGTVEFTKVAGPGSHLVAHLARANCLVVVPEDVTELPAGADVDVVLIEGALQ
jgi:molybdenum cofactor synthesis domain-containing protein